MSFREGWPNLVCGFCGKVMTPQEYFSSNLTRKEWSARKFCTPRCSAYKRTNKTYLPTPSPTQIEHPLGSEINQKIDLLILKAEVLSYEQVDNRRFE